jgi:DNA polymerase III subunit delta
MVALRGTAVDRFVTRPDPTKPIILVFGPDAGLVHERAGALIKSAVDDLQDPFSLARLDGDALAEEPERLVEEAHTVPLFGGRRAVWVRAGARPFVAAVERVLAAPPGADCRIVIEAGDLKRGAPLRSLCEGAAHAVALPCYEDSAGDLGRLIDEEMRGAGLTIAPDARALLLSLIGGDRAASRSEVQKLALYTNGKSSVERDDVIAVVTDATAPALDGVVDAAFAGKPADLEAEFAKTRLSGVAATTMAGAIIRHTATLHRLRVAVEQGRPIGDAVDGLGAALHFSRKDVVQAALKLTTAQRLEALLIQLGNTSLEVRKNARSAYPIVQRALLAIAQTAQAASRRR